MMADPTVCQSHNFIPKSEFRATTLNKGTTQADGWRVVDDDDYCQAVGEPQAEGVMSTAASFSLS
jgi:hypothetical protein